MSPSRPPLFGIFCCGAGGHAMATQSPLACLSVSLSSLLSQLSSHCSAPCLPGRAGVAQSPGRAGPRHLHPGRPGTLSLTSLPVSPESPRVRISDENAGWSPDWLTRPGVASGRGCVMRTASHITHSALSGSGCWELVTDRQGAMDPDISFHGALQYYSPVQNKSRYLL